MQANTFKLDEELHRDIEKCIIKIGDVLSQPHILYEKSGRNQWDKWTLGVGGAGIALFFSELSKWDPYNEWDTVAHKYLLDVRDSIQNNEVSSPSLYLGYAGIAYSVYFLSRNGTRYTTFLTKINELLFTLINHYIDQALINVEQSKVSPFDYDVIDGLSGVGRYLLLLPETNEVNQLIKRIIDYLIKVASYNEESQLWGWKIYPEQFATNDEKTRYPKGYYDVGQAHGISGILSFLSISLMKGYKFDGQVTTIESIYNWLLRVKTDSNTWPGRINLSSEDQSVTNYEAWCYGEPGIIRALWLAAVSLKDDSKKNWILRIYKNILNKSLSEYEIFSPTFCHGYAGLIQITNRMYIDSNDKDLHDYLQMLLKHLLSYYDNENRLLFRNYEHIEGRFTDNPGIISGSAGIGLVLLNLVSEKQSDWDAMFLIN